MPTLNERAKFATQYLRNALVLNAPADTTNLMAHGIGAVEDVSTNSWEIIIGGGTVDYAVYTNEPWVAPRWKGHSNPNQGWIENTIEACLPYMKMMMTGGVSESDVADLMMRQDKAIEKKRLDRIADFLASRGIGG